MSFKVYNFRSNDDIKTLSREGQFSVIEYQRDLSVMPGNVIQQHFMDIMNVRRRQLLVDLKNSAVVVSAGAMQWMLGDVEAATDVNGIGDLVGKGIKGKITGESAIKPKYSGTGMVVLEPTFKHLLLWDMADWPGGVVLDDGLFLACDASIEQTIKARSNFSSAVAGGKGFFNLCLKGNGIFCIESDCPDEELITVDLEDDQLKVDGNFAVAWSASLKFTVERTTRTLVGSAASGEGLVNVFRGTGRVIMQPTKGNGISQAFHTDLDD